MNRMSLSAIALSVIVAISSAVPVAAMPMARQPAASSSNIEQVKVVIRYGNWRGHRGYRNARPGYRRHSDGFWYPRAAFAVRVSPGVRLRIGATHTRWCRDRYMTYRASDNTYVATGGMRRVCRSPY